MPGKRKRKGPTFHPSFNPPTTVERHAALGTFPGAVHASASRASMIAAECHQPLQKQNYKQKQKQKQQPECVESIHDLNDPQLYVPVGRSETKFRIPAPRDEQDWLATVPEEGQTFDEYIRFLTYRSGRMRPLANAGRADIVLLPIIYLPEENSKGGKKPLVSRDWPAHGPPLQKLVSLTRAYFNRPVRLLPPAYISGSHKKKVPNTKPGSFATATKFVGSIHFPTSSQQGHTTSCRSVSGRSDAKTGRVQLQVEPILNELSAFRDGDFTTCHGGGTSHRESSFCVMGITMEDLYESPSDLFIAGLAFGGSKVALFSFARYHTHIKMHPGQWQTHGYGADMDEYSYFENDDKIAKDLSRDPPSFESLNAKSKSELLRRCGKLLVHELGHLYGVDHCIFHRCIMMGTGHLVEDFAAPFHLCPVCLRKFQWRLGFQVVERYKSLGRVFQEELGLDKEADWVKKQALGFEGSSEKCEKANVDAVIDLTSP